MWFRLGPLGDLRSLPPIERDQAVDVEASAPLAEHASLAGSKTQDRMGSVRSVWKLPWPYLTVDEVDELEAMRRGLLGGPLWLIDPLQPNVAPVPVATAGSDGKSPTGWSSVTGTHTWERLTVPPPVGVRNVGAISWTRATTTADVLSVGRDTVWQRVPLLPEGGEVTVTAPIRRSTATALEVSIGVDSWDADGTRTTSLADPVPLDDNDWLELNHAVVPPAQAVTWAPVWTVDADQPESTLHIPAVAMGYGDTPPAYSVGGGAARVFIRDLTKTYDDEESITAALTVVES